MQIIIKSVESDQFDDVYKKMGQFLVDHIIVVYFSKIRHLLFYQNILMEKSQSNSKSHIRRKNHEILN